MGKARDALHSVDFLKIIDGQPGGFGRTLKKFRNTVWGLADLGIDNAVGFIGVSRAIAYDDFHKVINFFQFFLHQEAVLPSHLAPRSVKIHYFYISKELL